jgi:hypothetical protein
MKLVALLAPLMAAAQDMPQCSDKMIATAGLAPILAQTAPLSDYDPCATPTVICNVLLQPNCPYVGGCAPMAYAVGNMDPLFPGSPECNFPGTPLVPSRSAAENCVLGNGCSVVGGDCVENPFDIPFMAYVGLCLSQGANAGGCTSMVDPSTGETGCAMANTRKVFDQSFNVLFAGAPEVAALFDAMVDQGLGAVPDRISDAADTCAATQLCTIAETYACVKYPAQMRQHPDPISFMPSTCPNAPPTPAATTCADIVAFCDHSLYGVYVQRACTTECAAAAAAWRASPATGCPTACGAAAGGGTAGDVTCSTGNDADCTEDSRPPAYTCAEPAACPTCGADFDCSGEATDTTAQVPTTVCDDRLCDALDCCMAPPPPPPQPVVSGAANAAVSAMALLVLVCTA